MQDASRAEISEGDRFALTFVSRKWPPAMGGMETYCLRLTQTLAGRADINPIVLPGNGDGSVPSAGALLGFGFRAAFQILSGKSARVVHLGDMAIWPLGLIARLRYPKAKLVASAHGTDVSFSLRGGLAARAYGTYLRVGALILPGLIVVANSAATGEMTRRFGFRNVHIVPLATDMPRQRHAGISPHQVLFSGRLTAGKGCAWFIRNVLPLLPDRLELAVAGTHWDADETAALDTPRVRYLGKLDPSDLAREYARSLCVIVPKIDVPSGPFEGFGLVAAEAAAAGGVVLAARHSGLIDAVVDGVTGFSLTPGDATVWAAAVGRIASWTAQERATFIDRAASEAARIYDWQRVADQTIAAYTLS